MFVYNLKKKLQSLFKFYKSWRRKWLRKIDFAIILTDYADDFMYREKYYLRDSRQDSENSCLSWSPSFSYIQQRESLRDTRRRSIHSAKNNSFCNRGTGSLTCLLLRFCFTSWTKRRAKDEKKKQYK